MSELLTSLTLSLTPQSAPVTHLSLQTQGLSLARQMVFQHSGARGRGSQPVRVQERQALLAKRVVAAGACTRRKPRATRYTDNGARRRGPPANERGSEDRRGAAVSVGGRGPGMDAVYRVRSGRKFYTHGKTPYRPRTLRSPPLSPRLRWAQRRSTSWPDRRGSRRGRTRDAGDRDGSRSHANPTHAYYVVHALTELTEIRIESDDCWDDVRRRPKREHFFRRNVGTFPESSTLPERERDCMQERHTRRLSRV